VTRPFRELVEALSPTRQELIAAKTELLMEIERLQSENAALRENESRLAFHVVPELEEQLRAADKLAEATEMVQSSWSERGYMPSPTLEEAMSAYLTARGKK
jgi:hypothetical protein